MEEKKTLVFRFATLNHNYPQWKLLIWAQVHIPSTYLWELEEWWWWWCDERFCCDCGFLNSYEFSGVALLTPEDPDTFGVGLGGGGRSMPNKLVTSWSNRCLTSSNLPSLRSICCRSKSFDLFTCETKEAKWSHLVITPNLGSCSVHVLSQHTMDVYVCDSMN